MFLYSDEVFGEYGFFIGWFDKLRSILLILGLGVLDRGEMKILVFIGIKLLLFCFKVKVVGVFFLFNFKGFVLYFIVFVLIFFIYVFFIGFLFFIDKWNLFFFNKFVGFVDFVVIGKDVILDVELKLLRIDNVFVGRIDLLLLI